MCETVVWALNRKHERPCVQLSGSIVSHGEKWKVNGPRNLFVVVAWIHCFLCLCLVTRLKRVKSGRSLQHLSSLLAVCSMPWERSPFRAEKSDAKDQRDADTNGICLCVL